MRRFRFHRALGVLGAIILWGPVCQGQILQNLAKWMPQPDTSDKLSVAGQDPKVFSYGLTAADLALGYDRPWQAKAHTMDPDFSAAYAVGGGVNVLLSPAMTLSTSLQFLWRKIDENGQQAVSHSSGLAGLNIRAVNLVIGIQARF